jgi:hypothetical protein
MMTTYLIFIRIGSYPRVRSHVKTDNEIQPDVDVIQNSSA